MDHLAQQIQSLVTNQSADHANDGRVRLLTQAHDFLKLCLARFLAAHVLNGVSGGNVGIGRRVIALHVNSIEHAGDLVAALAHDAVQTVGKEGHLQLIGIGGRHGVDGVSAEDGTLEQVHVAVHQDGAVVCPAVIQAEQVAQGLLAVTALILDVVDGQHRTDGAVAVDPDAVILQIHGHQSGLPVVAVDDFRPELHVVQHLHHSPGEEAESLSVVHISIQIRAIEVLLIVQEIPRDAIPLQREQAAIAVAPGQVHIVIAQEGQFMAVPLPHLLVQGQHHRYLRAAGGQGAGQRSRHIRETTGLAKRHRLAGRI